MNALLQGILEAGYVTSPSGERLPLHSHVSPEEGRFLQDLIHQIQPKVSLEIGCAFGVSSLYICEALVAIDSDRHIVIDPFQHEHWQGVGIENLKAAGFGALIEFHEIPSHQALPRLEAAGRRVDFVFVDGAHWFDSVMVDFFCIDRLLRVGGVVVFDDVNWAGVRKACRYILSNRAYTIFPESTGSVLPDSWMRRMVFKTPPLGDFLRRIAKPEFLTPDRRLSLDRRFVAMRKDADDTWIEGTKGGRSWDFHHEF